MADFRNNREAWPAEREGYSDVPATVYAGSGQTAARPARNSGSSIRTEEIIGGLMTMGGAAWITYVVTVGGIQISALVWNSHPVALTGIGTLIWLHAKYRRATRVK